MSDEEQRLYTLANTAALVLFNEHGNPPTLSLSQKVLAEQGTNLLKAYKKTMVVPAMEEVGARAGAEIVRLREALQTIADGHGGSAFAAQTLLQPQI